MTPVDSSGQTEGLSPSPKTPVHGAMGAHIVSPKSSATSPIKTLSNALAQGKKLELGINSTLEPATYSSLFERIKRASSQYILEEKRAVSEYFNLFSDAILQAKQLSPEKQFSELSALEEGLSQFKKSEWAQTLLGPLLEAHTAEIEHIIRKEKALALQTKLREIGYSQADAEKIITGYKTNWKGFFTPDPNNPTLVHQIHGIKGLKVYYDVQGKIVVDIAVSHIASGSTKSSKLEYQLTPEGELRKKARYHRAKTELAPSQSMPAEEVNGNLSIQTTVTQETKEAFEKDISHELEIRNRMGPLPHILNIKITGSYIDKHGEKKIRYEAELCDGKLENLIYMRPGMPVPPDKRQTKKALFCCLGILQTLEAMHAKRFVHKDIKPSNILYIKNEPKLIDFGFTAHTSDQFRREGTPENVAPEVIYSTETTKNDPKMDMFSFGTTLLAMYDPDLWNGFCCIQDELFDQPLKQYQDDLLYFQNAMNNNPPALLIKKLIARLLDFDPAKRPDAAQAEKLLKAALTELQKLNLI